MKILLVNPESPPTFWNFDGALEFIGKRSSEPPLGLLTVAAMLPRDWELRLVDLNAADLSDAEIEWADFVLLGGMSIQRRSFLQTVERCRGLGRKVIAGGPLVTTEHETLGEIDHLVIGEAESVLPELVADLSTNTMRRIYRSSEFPDLQKSPAPRWELLDLDAYANLSLQYSRGCPFDCEFCNIGVLNGRGVRTKSLAQFMGEIQSLYDVGWRGALFVVDDNFIGNKNRLRREILPALIEWQRMHGFPFSFTTECSINLADDEELLALIVGAGFEHVFVGIETVHEESLSECGKNQNRRRDLLGSVRTLQAAGLMVSAGFIVGFDSDPEDIFEVQSDFIRESGIPVAMVGLLSAPVGTRLYQRLASEGRLRSNMSGNNMDGTLNFIPKLEETFLLEGYRRLVQSLYAPRVYFDRLVRFLHAYGRRPRRPSALTRAQVTAFVRALWRLGVKDESRPYFWRLLFTTLFQGPHKFVTAVTLSIYGYHFRRIAELLA